VQGDHCLAHLTPDEWKREMQRLRRGAPLDARRVVFTEPLFQALLDALAHDVRGKRRAPIGEDDFGEAHFAGNADFSEAEFSSAADFSRTRFSGDADFSGVTFRDYADFAQVVFAGHANFNDTEFFGEALVGWAEFRSDADFVATQFSGYADFRSRFAEAADFKSAVFSGEAHFSGAEFSVNRPTTVDASFVEATFSGPAYFERTVFHAEARFVAARFAASVHFKTTVFTGAASFGGGEFSGEAAFEWARFVDGAWFPDQKFSGDASFGNAAFTGEAYFVDAHFLRGADFDHVEFVGDANFTRARFSGGAALLGPMVVAGALACDDAVFDEDVRLKAGAAVVSCRRTRFGGRAELSLRWAEVALDDAAFLGRSRLVGADPFPGVEDSAAQSCRADDRRLNVQERPRLLSVRGANVENLALRNVDLRACRFFGSHGLDALRVDADCTFATPRGCGEHTGAASRKSINGAHSVTTPLRSQSAVGTLRSVNRPDGFKTSTRALRRVRPASRRSIERCAKRSRTARTSPALATSTTARWKCAASGNSRSGPWARTS
jgi:uncharacterized protein YjbI with pentapeptide repeats